VNSEKPAAIVLPTHKTVKIGHRNTWNDLSGFHEDNARRQCYISSGPGCWRSSRSTRREKGRTAKRIRQLRSNHEKRHDEIARMCSMLRTIVMSNVHRNNSAERALPIVDLPNRLQFLLSSFFHEISAKQEAIKTAHCFNIRSSFAGC